MNSDDTSMYDDPSTPAYLRELLQAGRRANTGYDVERGLAKHLAAIAATAPAAHWAPAAAAARSGLPAWFGYVAMPLAAASVAGLLWLYSADRRAPTDTGTSTSALAPSEAAGVTIPGATPTAASAPTVATQPGAATDGSEARGSDDSRQSSSLERRRSGARSNAAHATNATTATSTGARGGRASLGTRAANDGDLNGVATVGGDSSATELRERDVRANGANSANGADARNAAKDSKAASESRTQAADSNAAVAEREAPEEAAEAARPNAGAKPVPVIDEARLEREMQMLAVTQRVLATDPGRALRLAEQGEREFSDSMFSAERRQLRLLALVKLGRLDEARRAGRPFLAHYPKAPWSERLRRALATGVVD